MLNKLLLTVVLVIAAWLGFKYWNRFVLGPYQRRQREMARRDPAPAKEEAAGEPPAHVQDMVECRVCGSYVAAGGGRCGRPDCPF